MMASQLTIQPSQLTIQLVPGQTTCQSVDADDTHHPVEQSLAGRQLENRVVAGIRQVKKACSVMSTYRSNRIAGTRKQLSLQSSLTPSHTAADSQTGTTKTPRKGNKLRRASAFEQSSTLIQAFYDEQYLTATPAAVTAGRNGDPKQFYSFITRHFGQRSINQAMPPSGSPSQRSTVLLRHQMRHMSCDSTEFMGLLNCLHCAMRERQECNDDLRHSPATFGVIATSGTAHKLTVNDAIHSFDCAKAHCLRCNVRKTRDNRLARSCDANICSRSCDATERSGSSGVSAYSSSSSSIGNVGDGSLSSSRDEHQKTKCDIVVDQFIDPNTFPLPEHPKRSVSWCSLCDNNEHQQHDGYDGERAVSTPLVVLDSSGFRNVSGIDEKSVASEGRNEAEPSSILLVSHSTEANNRTDSAHHLHQQQSTGQADKSTRKALARSSAAKYTSNAVDVLSMCKYRTKDYWTDSKIRPDEHIWLTSSGPTSSSNDTECYLGERECRKVGEKQQCAACHIVAHTACLPRLEQMRMQCKMTFNESYMQTENFTDELLVRHHWVHKWKQKGRCLTCAKSFQQKIFREKEVIAITCSWCKRSYHNKIACFSANSFDESCDHGDFKEIIVPSNWLLCTRPNSKCGKSDTRGQHRVFTIKPGLDLDQLTPSQPLLVFVNPKSGGNKGLKLLNTLCWLLNPRQVFDMAEIKGPSFGLDLYMSIAPSLRVLVCGGDGSVGWVLSALDKLSWQKYPPIGIIPLGTGNDLARCLGWGGSFNDEPLAHVLRAVLYETTVTYLDRWLIDVQPNLKGINSAGITDEISVSAQFELPLTVMNNYFSIGADAHIALQFHHSRSANPQMLNSRLKNRIAYGGLGTIDFFKRTWKSLHEYITLECDGVDMTAKIRDFKFHCILFHNIPYYAGGTVPWGYDSGDEFMKPSNCDGKIEVLGFTTATLAALQMGGRGERIAQCSRVRITTVKAIPMQVDGEPCLLAPSIITLSFHSQVPMLQRDKKLAATPAVGRRKLMKQTAISLPIGAQPSISLLTMVVSRNNFEAFRDNIEQLKKSAIELGRIDTEAETDLESVRQKVEKLLAECSMSQQFAGQQWRFLDSVSSAEEGIFRVRWNQEPIFTLSDICSVDECLFILIDETSAETNDEHQLIVNDKSERGRSREVFSSTTNFCAVLRAETQDAHV